MPPKSKQANDSAPNIKIPGKEVVKFVIKESLRKRKAMSQQELSEIISNELRKGDHKYRITGKRARLLSLEIPAKIKVETRKGPMPRRCPVCGRGLKRTHSKNLAGRKILTSIQCGRCGFRGAGGKWMPRKYSFSL